MYLVTKHQRLLLEGWLIYLIMYLVFTKYPVYLLDGFEDNHVVAFLSYISPISVLALKLWCGGLHDMIHFGFNAHICDLYDLINHADLLCSL
jgi:hypothetical protein